MDKNKEEVFKFTTKKGIDMRDNGKPIYQTVKVKSRIGTVHIILVNLKIIIGMEKGNFTTFKTKKQLNNFMKMAF